MKRYIVIFDRETMHALPVLYSTWDVYSAAEKSNIRERNYVVDVDAETDDKAIAHAYTKLRNWQLRTLREGEYVEEERRKGEAEELREKVHRLEVEMGALQEAYRLAATAEHVCSLCNVFERHDCVEEKETLRSVLDMTKRICEDLYKENLYRIYHGSLSDHPDFDECFDEWYQEKIAELEKSKAEEK